MADDFRTPQDLARRTAARRDASRRAALSGAAAQTWRSETWRRETFTLPREAARETARDYFARFPKAAYMTVVESWRETGADGIEFTMRRLPTAD